MVTVPIVSGPYPEKLTDTSPRGITCSVISSEDLRLLRLAKARDQRFCSSGETTCCRMSLIVMNSGVCRSLVSLCRRTPTSSGAVGPQSQRRCSLPPAPVAPHHENKLPLDRAVQIVLLRALRSQEFRRGLASGHSGLNECAAIICEQTRVGSSPLTGCPRQFRQIIQDVPPRLQSGRSPGHVDTSLIWP
jgi:hypothetical protein